MYLFQRVEERLAPRADRALARAGLVVARLARALRYLTAVVAAQLERARHPRVGPVVGGLEADDQDRRSAVARTRGHRLARIEQAAVGGVETRLGDDECRGGGQDEVLGVDAREQGTHAECPARRHLVDRLEPLGQRRDGARRRPVRQLLPAQQQQQDQARQLVDRGIGADVGEMGRIAEIEARRRTRQHVSRRRAEPDDHATSSSQPRIRRAHIGRFPYRETCGARPGHAP